MGSGNSGLGEASCQRNGEKNLFVHGGEGCLVRICGGNVVVKRCILLVIDVVVVGAMDKLVASVPKGCCE